MNRDPLALDFDRLETGVRLRTRARTITETDLVSFAALTGDWHPQHADAEWAAAGPFGERIAHGMLVLSYALGLLPIDPERVVALRGIRGVVFKRPVPIGATIAVEAEVTGLRALDDEHGLVELALRVLGADGRLVTRASIEALWRRDGAGAGDGGRRAAGQADETGAGANGKAAIDGPAAAASAAEAELSPCAEGRVLL